MEIYKNDREFLDDEITELIKKDSDEKYELLANLARREDNRNKILKNIPNEVLKGVDEHISQFSDNNNNSNIHTLEMICRLLGNLTYNHEENREIIIAYPTHKNIFSGLVAFVQQKEQQNLRKNACATILNLSSECDDIQEIFRSLDAVSALLGVVNDIEVNDDTRVWAIKAIGIIAEKNKLSNPDLLKSLKQSLEKNQWVDNEYAWELVELISELISEVELGNYLPEIFELIVGDGVKKQRDYIDTMSEEDMSEYDFKEKHLSIAPLAAHLVYMVSNSTQERGKLFKYLDTMLEIVFPSKIENHITTQENQKKNILKLVDQSKVVRTITRALAYASLGDLPEITNKLSEPSTLDKLIGLISDEETEQIVSGAMLIGNLAITDATNALLTQKGVVDKMSECMEKYPNHQPIQHLVLSACRNITLPTLYKNSQVKEQLLKVIIANMFVPNQVIQFAAISVLKNLIVANKDNYKAFINLGGLHAIIQLANGRVKASIDEDDENEENNNNNNTPKPKDIRVQCESSRIFIRFIENEKIEKEYLHDMVQPMFTLLKSTFAVLQEEGAKGLLSIANSTQEADFSEFINKFPSDWEETFKQVKQVNNQINDKLVSLSYIIQKNK